MEKEKKKKKATTPDVIRGSTVYAVDFLYMSLDASPYPISICNCFTQEHSDLYQVDCQKSLLISLAVLHALTNAQSIP